MIRLLVLIVLLSVVPLVGCALREGHEGCEASYELWTTSVRDGAPEQEQKRFKDMYNECLIYKASVEGGH